ncbi:hypothetical protein [Streptomyces sp. NBC_00134]|uniref:hypothetical protein n=1 Tax=Streptomyces sp. NBC_00134 TaxID=2975663 RepID=UPI002F90A2CB
MTRLFWKQNDSREGQQKRRKLSAGTAAAALAFVICTSVSLNTSFRFTLDGLDMHGMAERLLSCAAFEALIAMCVLGARERMAGPDKSPGWYGSAVWIFAALSSIPAWHEGGGLTTSTVVRIIVGSFGSALAAHSALGLELKHRTGDASQTALAQISRDLRERLMARLGLAHRGQTAQEIAQRRALNTAVDLYARHESCKKPTGWWARRLASKLATAQDRAGVHTDEEARTEYRARCAGRKFAATLHIADAESPWHTGAPAEATVTHMEDLAAQATAQTAAQARAALAQNPAHVPGQRLDFDTEDEARWGDEDGLCGDDAQPDSGKAAAAQGPVPIRVEARVPHTPDTAEDGDERQENDRPRELSTDLKTYKHKKEAAESLYLLQFRHKDDGTRKTNAVAEEVADAFKAWFGESYDRSAVFRAIEPLRPAVRAQAEQRELAGV